MLKYNQENVKCIFESNKYKYAIMAIYIIILFGFIALNIMVYNKLIAKARARFTDWNKIEDEKNKKLMAAITAKLNNEQQPNSDNNVTPDMG